MFPVSVRKRFATSYLVHTYFVRGSRKNAFDSRSLVDIPKLETLRWIVYFVMLGIPFSMHVFSREVDDDASPATTFIV